MTRKRARERIYGKKGLDNNRARDSVLKTNECAEYSVYSHSKRGKELGDG